MPKNRTKKIEVFNDGIGFIRLVESMGDDWSAVQAARVSFGSGRKGEEEDAKLIEFLMLNGHMSPFEHIVFKFHVACPLFVRSQWFRHRTWSYNEISRRYTSKKLEFYNPYKVRKQSISNRQASIDSDSINQEKAHAIIQIMNEKGLESYQKLLDLGVAREQARMVLPQSMYTEFYATVNLRNLLHFIKLRIDSHAQWEIRLYAKAILKLINPIAPLSIQAFAKKYNIVNLLEE